MGRTFVFVGRGVVHYFVLFVRGFSGPFVSNRRVRFRVCKEDRVRYVAPDPAFRNLAFFVIGVRQSIQEVIRRPLHAYLNEVWRVLVFVLVVRICGGLSRDGVVDVVRSFVKLPTVAAARFCRPVVVENVPRFHLDRFDPVRRSRMGYNVYPVRYSIFRILLVDSLPVNRFFRGVLCIYLLG